MRKHLFCTLALTFAGAAAAQTAPQPDPRDPKAPVPALEYRSAFADYRPFADEKLAPWRGSNEAVVGGASKDSNGAQAPAAPMPPNAPGGMGHGDMPHGRGR